ncbi:hypothetical protein DRO26_00275 [Candidatus Bathyarchaeota archaeon]|nr:MAG: hypothetical protein DRO26_00275 [Candidatus Bathyarchaeota archaeon]
MVKVLAFEDGSFRSNVFRRKRKGKAFLVGVLVEDFKIEKVVISHIQVDGFDVTERLVEIVKKIKTKPDVLMLASIAYAGFNLVDPTKVYGLFKIPVLIVNPKKPDDLSVEIALKRHFKDWKKRLEIIHRAGKPIPLKIEDKQIYIYCFGLTVEEAENMVKGLMIFGNRPEPLRIANLIARGLGYVD